MAAKIKPIDIAEHLETDDDIRVFLEEAATIGDAADFIHALNIAARAKGMSEVARQAGVTRASLYKSLADDGNPRFETISKIVSALGCHLAVVGDGEFSAKTAQ
ncbi:MAG: addiction module antidote protein [Candidatus Sedimenticola endophacoides]